MVLGELTVHHQPRDRTDDAHQPAQRPLGDEVDASAATRVTEEPSAIDRKWSLDDVYVQSVGPVELGEFNDLLELSGARRPCPLADAITLARRPIGERLHPGLGGLPVAQVCRVGDIVEHGLR